MAGVGLFAKQEVIFPILLDDIIGAGVFGSGFGASNKGKQEYEEHECAEYFAHENSPFIFVYISED